MGEKRLAKTDLVQQASEKIEIVRKCMKITEDHQKYYANHRSWDLEFQVGDRVFLQALPQRSAMRDRKCGKLSPRYLGSYRIIELVGPLAYRLSLP